MTPQEHGRMNADEEAADLRDKLFQALRSIPGGEGHGVTMQAQRATLIIQAMIDLAILRNAKFPVKQ